MNFEQVTMTDHHNWKPLDNAELGFGTGPAKADNEASETGRPDFSLESDNGDGLAGDSSGDHSIDLSLESDDAVHESDTDTNANSETDTTPSLSSDFQTDTWNELDADGKRQALTDLGEYNSDALGLDNRPKIEFYQSSDASDYGRYSEDDNTIYVNESNLEDPGEAIDTISHEYRHAYQHGRAQNPRSDEDLAFRDNFDNYISASRDYEGYQSQLVESDARQYAQAVTNNFNVGKRS